jgi:TetR/AcrR family transcriptional regulator
MSDYALSDSVAAGSSTVKRSQQKRSLILNAAMHHFAEHGYEAARVGDMANQLGIAKGSVFQHFGTKDGLFFEAYKSALRSLPPYLEVPSEIKNAGFFAVVRHRLSGSPEFLEKYRVPYRIIVLGNYGSDLSLKRRITQFVGVERGEIRTDIDRSLVTSMLECTFERMHDLLLTAEVDPDLFHRAAGLNGDREKMIDQFVTVLRGAIGTPLPLNPPSTRLLS